MRTPLVYLLWLSVCPTFANETLNLTTYTEPTSSPPLPPTPPTVTSTDTTTTTTKTSIPIVVPDDEDLIDDNHWEQPTSSQQDTSKIDNKTLGLSEVSWRAFAAILTTLTITFILLVCMSICVWSWGGGHEISQMMASNSQVATQSDARYLAMKVDHRINKKKR
jgi:hypothetical protein